MMSEAERLFRYGWRKTREQGKKSQDGTRCLYRSPDGSKCPVGHCIPDALYKPDMEGMSVHNFTLLTRARLGWTNEVVSALEDAQHAHDGAASGNFVVSFDRGMANRAAQLGFNTEIP